MDIKKLRIKADGRRKGGGCLPDEILSAYGNGEEGTIPASELRALQAHLDTGCERCVAYVDRFRKLAALTEDLIDTALSQRLWMQLERDRVPRWARAKAAVARLWARVKAAVARPRVGAGIAWEPALAWQASVLLIAIGPLYAKTFFGPKHPPVDRIPIVERTVTDPSPIQVRTVLENVAFRRQQEQLYTMLLNVDFEGRDRLILGSLARHQDENDVIDSVSSAIGDRTDATSSPAGARFEAAVALYGAKVIQQRGEAYARSLLPINGVLFTSHRGPEDPGAVSYFYAQMAVQRLRDLLRTPAHLELDDKEAQRALIEKVMPNPGQPWPAAVRQALPSAGNLLVIEVKPKGTDLTRGRIVLTVLDADTGKRESEEIPFASSLPPIPIRGVFTREDNQRGHAQLGEPNIDPATGRRPPGDEFAVSFEGLPEGDDFVSMRRPPNEGLRIDERRFGAKKGAEVCFETRIAFSGKGPMPTVQFTTGGGGVSDDVRQSGVPPGRYGPRWQRVSIPVDLSDESTWNTGLTATVRGKLAPKESMTIHIRNAYVRPFGEKPAGPNDVPRPPQDRSLRVPTKGAEVMMLDRREMMKCTAVALTTVLLTETTLLAQDQPKSTPKGESRRPGDVQRPADEVGTPLYVYDNDRAPAFAPGGWMPDGDIELSQTLTCKEKPRGERGSCYRAKGALSLTSPWMAVAFLPGGKFQPVRKVDVAKELGMQAGEPVALRFWARSPNKATVQFKVGGLDEDSIEFAVKTKWIELEPEWKMYTVDLTGNDLKGVRGALIWSIDQEHNEGKERIQFDLDDIYFTRLNRQPVGKN